MRFRLWSIAALFSTLLGVAAPARANLPPAGQLDDRFLAGYAAAVLGHEFHVPRARVLVRDGAILVDGRGIDAPTRVLIQNALTDAPGVRSARVLDPAEYARLAGGPAESMQDGSVQTLAPPPGAAAPPGPPPVQAQVVQGVEILPRSILFKPLRADPRWPHFSAAYDRWTNDRDVKDAGTVSFGETIPFVRGPGLDGQWEVGLQAGVFAVFDLGGESADLINADYQVGIPVSYRRGNFSTLLRVYHQSSHLGDEYILREGITKAQRVNLSYETVNGLVSYDFGPNYRLYGGLGWLFDTDPGDLKRWTAQTGAEFQGSTVWWNALRPVAALDLQYWQQHHWRPNISLRAGVQLENLDILSRKILFVGEYFNGHNPNGQFYTRDLQYLGLGAHVFLQ